MYVLGISAFYHDSAAVLIKDGNVICAAEEERFTRIKHDNQFPFNAVDFCLKDARISFRDLQCVAYYEKPLLKFERILEHFVRTYPFSLRPFLQGIPEWLEYKLGIERLIRKKLGYAGEVFFIPHHLSHAAAAFYPSPFEEAAILTVDGVGEYQTTGLWKGEGNGITPLEGLDFPNSLGLLYSTFTAFLGFQVNEDEYKVMGLGAYGTPHYTDKIYQLIDIKDDGSFTMDMRYFSFREAFQMWSKNFETLFGKPRLSGQPITRREKDIAASIQEVTEEIYFKILNHLHELTGYESVCIGGGVALNALANGKIYRATPFKRVYILGAAGDSGGALGAGLLTYHQIFKQERRHPVHNLCLGSSYTNEQIEEALQKAALVYERIADEEELLDRVVSHLVRNKVVAWFQGRMEFGPRALGARSILAKPNPARMKEVVNRIKIREQFRPFAGSILQEKVHEYFDIPEKNHRSPFMIFCFRANKKAKQDLAAIVHPDNTTRIQTVDQDSGRYYRLIRAFYKSTGIPCLLNTSFNLKGEPLVESPEQAIRDFLKTEMDCMAIGDFFVEKERQRK